MMRIKKPVLIASFSLETTKHTKIQSLLHFITIRLSDITLGSLVFSEIKGSKVKPNPEALKVGVT